MPVTFEPAQPVGSSIAEEYGRLTQQNRRAEFSLKQAEAQAAAHARDQANANDMSRMNAQVNMAEEENRLRSQAQTAQMQTSVNEKQMGIDAQAQSQQREFNYADGIRLQNMQQQRSMIENDSSLDDSEKADLLRQVDPNISALKFRQAQTQMQQERLQNDRLRHQTAAAATMNALNGQMMARMLPDSTIRHHDDDGNLIAITHPDGHGGFHTTAVRHGGGQGESAAPSQQVMARFVLAADRAQAQELLNAQRSGQSAPAWSASAQAREADAQRRVNEMVRRHSGGGGATPGGYEADRGALMTDLGGLLGQAAPRVTPRPQPTPVNVAPPQSSADVPL